MGIHKIICTPQTISIPLLGKKYKLYVVETSDCAFTKVVSILMFSGLKLMRVFASLAEINIQQILPQSFFFSHSIAHAKMSQFLPFFFQWVCCIITIKFMNIGGKSCSKACERETMCSSIPCAGALVTEFIYDIWEGRIDIWSLDLSSKY